MAKLFSDILNEAMEKGMLFENSKQSTSWLINKSLSISEDEADPEKIIEEEKASVKTKVTFGKMYLFKYNPKTKQKLKYYDTFPLIFPFEKRDNGFLGINFHYLSPLLRAKLMDGLYNFGPSNIQDNSKLSLQYENLVGFSKTRYFKPCIKHYLNSQLQSRFVEIPASQWKIALFLPLERFSKASKEQVFRDSRRIIKGA